MPVTKLFVSSPFFPGVLDTKKAFWLFCFCLVRLFSTFSHNVCKGVSKHLYSAFKSIAIRSKPKYLHSFNSSS